MKATIRLTLLALAALSPPALASDHTQCFDNFTGKPNHWSAGVTGKGEAVWKVVKAEGAPSGSNVLKQSGVADYAVILKDEPLVQDGFVEVKGRAVSGKKDQAIGVIFRAKDADNYYVCRANALEDNVVLYKTVAGKRSSLDIVGRKGGYGVEVKVEPQKWHTLRVEFSGDVFKVLLNGKELFQVKDDTFKEAGKTGLWTKADSVILFDDFSCGDRSAAEIKAREAAKPYPLKWCLCTEDSLADTTVTEEVISFIHHGQEFRVCCNSCKTDFFDKEPEKYVKRLAEAVAAGEIEKPKK